MKKIAYSMIVASCLFGGVHLSHAQSPGSYAGYDRQPVVTAPIWNYPHIGYGAYASHASTYEAGVLNGLGSLYRGAGEYQVASSVAAYNWQLARAAALQNSIHERAARAQIYRHMHIAQELKHQENIKKNQAVAAFHHREQSAVLAANQIDRSTGELTWPVGLQNAKWSEDRTDIEAALQNMHDSAQVSQGADKEFARSVSALRRKVTEHKSEFRPSTYFATLAFLDRLKNETRVAVDGLAMN